mmetsp:Transcript_20795/g.63986  ORF Transcript_20795/g.63986 Transcript_20795/m.63986 type:complete len:301 (-) Transcript_20795:54-956(-)
MGEKPGSGGGSGAGGKIAGVLRGVKRSNMLAPWLAFGCVSFVIYMAFSDGDFSFLLTYGSLTRCFAVLLLVTKLQQSQSATGISAKSLHAYFFVFASRLLSILRHDGYLPYDRSGDWIYHCVEVASCLAVIVALLLVHGPYKRTYDATLDAFGNLAPIPPALGAAALIVPAFVFAAVFHPGLNKDFLSDTTWTFAMYLESFAILPQLFLFQKASKQTATVDYLVGHFVAALGLSRVVEMLFWMNSFTELADRNGNKYVGILVLGTQCLHLIIMLDFFFFYFRSVSKGVPISLPRQASDNV